jgi:hypothetical protein
MSDGSSRERVVGSCQLLLISLKEQVVVHHQKLSHQGRWNQLIQERQCRPRRLGVCTAQQSRGEHSADTGFLMLSPRVYESLTTLLLVCTHNEAYRETSSSGAVPCLDHFSAWHLQAGS